MPEKEIWLKGPVQDVPALLQPVAHALLQAREEVSGIMKDFPASLLWQKPAGVASPGFHLQHLQGVLERLFTYADSKALSDAQLETLNKEVQPNTKSVDELVDAFNMQVDASINYLKHVDETILTQHRVVGRKQMPSTVLGLLFHAAEHTMRHVGQLMVTAKVIDGSKPQSF